MEVRRCNAVGGPTGRGMLAVPAAAAAGAGLAFVKTIDVLAQAVRPLVAAGWRVAVGTTVLVLRRLMSTVNNATEACRTAQVTTVTHDGARTAGLRTDLGCKYVSAQAAGVLCISMVWTSQAGCRHRAARNTGRTACGCFAAAGCASLKSSRVLNLVSNSSFNCGADRMVISGKPSRCDMTEPI